MSIAQEFAISKLLLEEEAVLEAGHIVACSILQRGDNSCSFVGFVLQTSALSRDTHKLGIMLEERTVSAASCSCKAGYAYDRIELSFGLQTMALEIII